MRKTNLNSNAWEQYVSPGMQILSFSSEGLLCTSPGLGGANEPGDILTENPDNIYDL